MIKLKELFNKIYYYLPIGFILKPIVLFESNPDYCDNARGVYERLIELGYNNKLKLVWFVQDKSKFSDIHIKNVEFVDMSDKKKVRYYQLLAKYILDCNRFIFKRNKHQLRIHLTHGTPIKYTPEYSLKCGKLDYLVQISDYFTKYNIDLFNVKKEQIVSIGFPRNDILFKDNKQVFFPNIKRKKTICWFPTYRNHKNHSSGIYKLPYGIPAINNTKELKELNDYLKKEDVLLVIKLHPAEDTTILKELDFDRIKLINDDIFNVDHSILYHYLSNVDALITDYSSLYYDFLLTKKPIGMAISDIKEYTKVNQVIFDADNFPLDLPGEYIYTFDDLLKFINNVSNNNDISYKKRMKKMSLYHKYIDGNSADRVIEIMGKKGSLK